MPHGLIPILPCNDLQRSEQFYAQLGFINPNPGQSYEDYLLLEDRNGGHLHLTKAEEGWLIPGRNPFGLYFYTRAVDELAAKFGSAVIGGPEHKPWGMYEFGLSDPDESLVRVGWPSKLTQQGR